MLDCSTICEGMLVGSLAVEDSNRTADQHMCSNLCSDEVTLTCNLDRLFFWLPWDPSKQVQRLHG
jgi:hypothetical protein